jgi:hypothetical protein
MPQHLVCIDIVDNGPERLAGDALVEAFFACGA